MQLVGLRVGLLLRCCAVKLIREFFVLLRTEGFLNKATSFTTRVADKTLGLHGG